MPLLSVRRNVSVRRHAVEDEDEDEYGIDYEELEQCLVKFGEAQKQEFSNVNNRLKALSCRTKCSIVIIALGFVYRFAAVDGFGKPGKSAAAAAITLTTQGEMCI